MSDLKPSSMRRRDLLVAFACGGVAGVMVAASFAAVPLYNWFCRVTGFAGTPQIASGPPPAVIDRKITVRFDANVGGGLPWRFAPERTAMEVRLGEVVSIDYIALNESMRESVGVAAFNVTPLNIGAYFHKINCFCFTDQRLRAGERREMTVVFYVDPALAQDPDGEGVNTITLSYTFYPQRPVAKSASPNQGGQI